MKIVGLDISLTATGIAANDGHCQTIGRDGVTVLPLAARLDAVDQLVAQILDAIGITVDLVVVEGPALSRSSGGAVERHALYWLLVRRLARREIPVAVVSPPTRIRYAIGKGVGSKAAVVDAVARRWPQFETAGDNNLADAAVLCAMGCDWAGVPLAVMPAAHRKALDVVAWPAIVPAGAVA